MTNPRPKFRREALRRYHERREQPVFLRLAPPRVFYQLCLAAVAVCACAGLIMLAPVPTYVSACALAARGDKPEPGEKDVAVVAVLLKPETVSQVAAGQKVFFGPGGGAPKLSGAIREMAPGPLSLEQARSRYGLSQSVKDTLEGGIYIALVELDQAAFAEAFPNHGQMRFDALIEVGARRARLPPGLF